MKASDLLPDFLARRLAGRDTLQGAIDNSAWLFADQVVRMVVGLLVGIWVARYLGPQQYGWLNYATAIVGTVTALTSLGLNAVVVRELVREPEAASDWMGTAFFLKSAAGTLGFLICLVIAWGQPPAMELTRPLIVIVAVGLFFQGFDVFDVYFQAKGASRVSAWVRIGACVCGALLRVALLLAHASLVALTLVTVVELVIIAVGWLVTGYRAGQTLRSFGVARRQVRILLAEGWPLAVSVLAVHVQASADQMVIGLFLGATELGEYSAALRVVNLFAFVPMVIQTVAVPEITRARCDDARLYRRRLYDFYRLMFGLFLLVALPLMVLGPWLVTTLFGRAYTGAGALLPLLALRHFFTSMGISRSAFITNEGLFRFALGTAVAGAAVNLICNAFLVPAFGVRGAIFASFASFGTTIFLLEFLQPQARENLALMARAIFLCWRRFDD